MTSRTTTPTPPLQITDQSEENTEELTNEVPKRISSPPPVLPSVTQEDGASDTFGFDLLELARKQETENQALLHFLSGTSTSNHETQSKPETKEEVISSFNDHQGLNSEALLDDLIPSKDPCYLNMKLRDSSVLLLHSITAESVYSFINSLAKDCYEIYFGSIDEKSREKKEKEKEGEGEVKKEFKFNEDEKEMIIEENWIRIKKSIEKNRNSLCSNARLETQLLVAQHLLEARSRNSSTTTDDLNYVDQIAEEVSIELHQLVKTREECIEEGKIKIRELISVTGNVFWDKIKIPLFSNP
ncbi:hypothetical protein DFH28DRAFT_636177 [Melampsora americana]|nr:hypothetical protein DFH28DRAFT_636177 [Melampsora americana]